MRVLTLRKGGPDAKPVWNRPLPGDRLFAPAAGVFALLYVPGKLVVAGNATATADRIRASETLLRLGIAADVLSTILFVFVALVLYRLFKPVSERAALAMMVLILLSFPSLFVGVLNAVDTLNFAGVGHDANDVCQGIALARVENR